MEPEGLIEFHYADGRVVSGAYADYARSRVPRGRALKYDGQEWLMYDREDRDGVAVHHFRPGTG